MRYRTHPHALPGPSRGYVRYVRGVLEDLRPGMARRRPRNGGVKKKTEKLAAKLDQTALIAPPRHPNRTRTPP